MNIGAENELNEFKESLTQLDKGLKSLTAMMNKHNKGDVYFGINDDGDVVGLTIGKETDTKIRARIKELVEPKFIFYIDILDDGNKKYIKLHGDGSDIPYSCDGRYYIRNAQSDDIVSNELLRKMLISKNLDILAEGEARTQNLTFSTFVKILNTRGIHATETRQFYENFNLFNKEGKYSLFAYLLSDQNNIPIKAITYAGKDKVHMYSKEDFGCKCLLSSVFEILDYFRVYNVKKINLSTGIREEKALFVFEAFREAIVNACVHNDWTQGLPPSIYIYDDRLEIVSYGSLPFNLSIEDFYNGKSMPVNRSLFNVFLMVNLSEQSGHGINMITSAYGKDSIIVEENMIIVTIPFSYTRDEVLVRIRNESVLNDNAKKVLNLLSSNSNIKLSEISLLTNLSLSGVKKIISKLTEQNFIRREGSKKDSKWIILK